MTKAQGVAPRARLVWVLAALAVAGAAGCDDEGDGGPAAPGDGGLPEGGVADVPVGAGDVSLDGLAGGVVAAGKLVVRGRLVNVGGAAAAVAGALVRITIDRDKNGTIAANEAAQATTAADGSYVVETAVSPGDTAVVRIAKEGIAPILRTIGAGSGGEVTVDGTAAATASLACAAGTCAAMDSSLSLAGLPAGATASGAAFNPVTETDKFPGSFDDSAGNLLKSAVFAAIEVKDSAGQPVTALPTPAILRLRLPADTYSLVADTKPGTDKIEVPLYSFNEVSGQWVADGEGYLEDGAGSPIAESNLASIRARSYAGMVVARGEITHASYWNIDWPLTTHSCITGLVVDGSGAPLPGAAILSGGVDYTASYKTQITPASGRFCLDVLRGEAVTEDVDGNGKQGEAHKVSLHVQYGQRLYLVGAVAPTTTMAVCGGACADAGTLTLTADREVKTALEGHWAGDWGDMLLKKVGEEYWGAYLHDTGTVVLRPGPDGVYRGWWSETPSRMPTADAGEVEFRFAWNGTELVLDGQWRYGEAEAFRPDWDLKHVTTPVPAELEMRFADAAAFVRHP